MSENIAIDARQISTHGIGRYIHNLLASLKPSGDYSIYVIHKPDQTTPDNFGSIEINAEPLSIEEQAKLPLALHNSNIDILHSPNFNIPLFSRVKQITTIHDCAYTLFPEELSERSLFMKSAYRVGFRAAIKRSDHIITVSSNTKHTLCTYFGVDPNRISVINLAAKKASHPSPLPAQLDDTPYMLYVGSTRPRKNIPRLLSAFKRFHESYAGSGPKLVMVGSETDKFTDIESVCSDLGIEDSVLQLGFVSDEMLSSLYSNAVFLCFPSLYEGFGLPALESISHGTPVLGSNISSLPEVIGDAGILVDPYDTAKIAEGMTRLWTNHELRNQLASRCEVQSSQFSWEKCAQRTSKVYEQISRDS